MDAALSGTYRVRDLRLLFIFLLALALGAAGGYKLRGRTFTAEDGVSQHQYDSVVHVAAEHERRALEAIASADSARDSRRPDEPAGVVYRRNAARLRRLNPSLDSLRAIILAPVAEYPKDTLP